MPRSSRWRRWPRGAGRPRRSPPRCESRCRARSEQGHRRLLLWL